MKNLTPCLWFNGVALEAAEFYCSVFRNSRMGDIAYYGDGMPLPAGTVLTVDFEIDGKPFVALNAGNEFQFNEAVSFQIFCKDQEETDYFWEALRRGGGEEGPCGWLKDRYGLSWQVIPEGFADMHKSPDKAAVNRAMAAMMTMKKLDMAALQAAFDGK